MWLRAHVNRCGRILAVLLLVVVTLGADFSQPATAQAVTLSGVTAKVTNVGGVNLRTRASWSGAVIAALPKGTKLTITGTSSDWF